MLSLVNQNIPPSAIRRLEHYSEVVLFQADDFGFPFLSGHVDLFFCNVDGQIVVAPNTPDRYLKLLADRNIPFLLGENSVGEKRLGSYNVAVGNQVALGNRRQIDSAVYTCLNGRPIITVKQSFARCTTLPLPNGHFITSDPGINKRCIVESIPTLLVEPSGIVLPGYRSGCFGGCCGINNNRLFLIGMLKNHPHEKAIRHWLEEAEVELIELYDGPLFDAGSILMVDY